ncbi:hypothetical protein G7046_g1003 [Stylonectria norvegica]|nr:hypothetical protein G7046_g1003 [Stylonectria norvegica]
MSRVLLSPMTCHRIFNNAAKRTDGHLLNYHHNLKNYHGRLHVAKSKDLDSFDELGEDMKSSIITYGDALKEIEALRTATAESEELQKQLNKAKETIQNLEKAAAVTPRKRRLVFQTPRPEPASFWSKITGQTIPHVFCIGR